MSDTITTNDAAIEIITERVHKLDADIARHKAAIDVATASRSELADLIATLSRKPRARKARAAEPAANVVAMEPPAPSIFAPVVAEAVEEAA
jgi:septal ring factor EnvC (AmiA/AmiB activator)